MADYFKQRLRSFKFAFQGIYTLLRETPNARIHFVMAIFAVLLGFLLNISQTEWIVVIMVIGIVLALEAINSSIETFADFISPSKNDAIKKVKDLSAAAVLIAAIIALIIGSIIFLPKIFTLIIK